MIPQDTTEIIWTFSGTVVGLILCVAVSAIFRQVRHNSTGSTQADRWEDASNAVKGFVLGDATGSEKFSKLLARNDTRAIVIEAFSNVARANPESAKALRHRKEDAAILRKWVSDSLEDKDSGRRAHACEVVATLRLRACLGMVLAATGDEDANVRVTATRALCVLDPETAVGVLLGLIETEGSWAADLLSDLLQRVPVQALAAVMQRAREWGATPALVKLLAGCPSEVANSILLSALETDSPELRARVAEAIHASSPEAIAALATLLTDPHEGTRLSAVRSLGRVRNPKALITLSSALSDISRLVRFAAAEGIGGTAGGPSLLQRIVEGSDLNAAEAAELALWRLQSEAANPQLEVASSPVAIHLEVPIPEHPLPLSAQLARLTDCLEASSDLTFETALATLLDDQPIQLSDQQGLRSASVPSGSALSGSLSGSPSGSAQHVVPVFDRAPESSWDNEPAW
jgi:HEAT repeat protein